MSTALALPHLTDPPWPFRDASAETRTAARREEEEEEGATDGVPEKPAGEAPGDGATMGPYSAPATDRPELRR